jgi:hypothetical protein
MRTVAEEQRFPADIGAALVQRRQVFPLGRRPYPRDDVVAERQMLFRVDSDA